MARDGCRQLGGLHAALVCVAAGSIRPAGASWRADASSDVLRAGETVRPVRRGRSA